MGIGQRRRVIGQAPEQDPEADVAPQLAHAEEQGKSPVTDHADKARETTGKDLLDIINNERKDDLSIIILSKVGWIFNKVGWI